MSYELINTYSEFVSNRTFIHKTRELMRSATLFILSKNKSISSSTGWIRFPYYHHVFDDERKDFERQLRYMKQFGEFISLDDVCSLLEQKVPIDGRYFCLSFDDGYRCLYDNMVPITDSLNIPVIIYIPTDYIGLSENNPDDLPMIQANLPWSKKLLSFLNWEQCNEMLSHQVSFGSHTKTHARLADLPVQQIEEELKLSKEKIELMLNRTCYHFACPWGRTYIDYDPNEVLPQIRKLGFRSFATTIRGLNQQQQDRYQIKRDHFLAQWGNHQLRYFLASGT